jgi:Uma2 family endonuclease
VQDPVVLGDYSAPQPDIAVVRYAEDFHARAHPGANDVLLAVEVADSTVKKDLARKARLYAEFAVPEYWVVDLSSDRVVVHTMPGARGYGSIRSFRRGSAITAAVFPGRSWPVS